MPRLNEYQHPWAQTLQPQPQRLSDGPVDCTPPMVQSNPRAINALEEIQKRLVVILNDVEQVHYRTGAWRMPAEGGPEEPTNIVENSEDLLSRLQLVAAILDNLARKVREIATVV